MRRTRLLYSCRLFWYSVAASGLAGDAQLGSAQRTLWLSTAWKTYRHLLILQRQGYTCMRMSLLLVSESCYGRTSWGDSQVSG